MKLRYRYEPSYGQTEDDAEVHVEQSFRIEENPDNSPRDEDGSVKVPFKWFGRGERPRNYEVEINWLDLENLIAKFIEIEHPHAQYLKKILQLARSVGSSGWHNDDEPVEFWDVLLP
jgi:hypothetical protein